MLLANGFFNVLRERGEGVAGAGFFHVLTKSRASFMGETATNLTGLTLHE